LAPYTNARIGAAAVGSEIPADLLPDDPPTPDKPGPLHPIL
jgi:hypothetical protein